MPDNSSTSVTIGLTEREEIALTRLMVEQELSASAVLRQALRSYQRDHERLKAGETVTWSGDEQRARDFAGPWAGADREVEETKDFSERWRAVHDAILWGMREPLLRRLNSRYVLCVALGKPTPEIDGSFVEAVRFLLDRLVDHEVRMTSEEDTREWQGHVVPAMSRLREAITDMLEESKA